MTKYIHPGTDKRSHEVRDDSNGLAVLEADKDILDWLEKNGANICITCWKGTGAETNPWTIHGGDFCDDKVIGEANTLREAVLDAMRSQQSLSSPAPAPSEPSASTAGTKETTL